MAWLVLNADKEENPQRETPLHHGFLKATCKKILVTTWLSLHLPLSPHGSHWKCGHVLMLPVKAFNSH